MTHMRIVMPGERPRGRGRAAAVATLVVCAALLGATGMRAWDAARWRDAGSAARSIAGSSAADETQRLQAMVVMRRDICAGIAILRDNQKEVGPVANGAENALQLIREAAR